MLKIWYLENSDCCNVLYNINKINTTQPLIICTGEGDCAALIECGFYNSVSINGGDQNTKWIEECWDFLQEFDEIILVHDNDRSGEEYIKKVAPRLGEYRVKVAEIPLSHTNADGEKVRIKDINELLFFEGKEAVRDVINNAKESEIPAIVDYTEVKRFDMSDVEGFTTGFEDLDAALGKNYMGSTTLITGIASAGKSSLISTLVCRSIEQGYPCFIYSGELSNPSLKNWIDFVHAGQRGLEEVQGEHGKYYRIKSDVYRKINSYYRGQLYFYKDSFSHMLRSPVGIFQMESSFAFSLLKTFEPHSIFDMALVTAAIRPSGASYRDRLMKKIPNKNPSKEIDELLKNNLGYLIFQEDIIAFLQQMCGLSGSEADNVRRAIGRKDAERLEKAIPKILNGYCKHSSKPRKEAEEDAKAFLKVIEDASEYSFGYNHAVEYCLTGYLCAYLRKYYPCEFITTYLNRAAKEEDVVNGTTLAAEYGFKVTPPRFGASRDVFYFNKEKKEIAKGLTSVKYMSAALANELYDIYDEVKGKSFMEVLKALSKTSIDTRQLDILIKIGYFEEFGNMGELLKLVQVYSFFKNGTAKSVSKSKVVGFLTDIISDYATGKGVKGNELKSYTITDMDGLLAACEEQIRKSNIPDLTLKVKIQNSIDYLGYVGIQTGLPEDRRKLLITEVFPMRGQNGVPWGYKVNTQSLGTGKQSSLTIPARIYAENQVAKGDIVYADNCYKNPKGYWYLNSYRKI